jgi:hypothetical protein
MTSCIECSRDFNYSSGIVANPPMSLRSSLIVSVWALYITVHQQDSSQPQQSQDSPQERTGWGLMMEETEEAMLPGILKI